MFSCHNIFPLCNVSKKILKPHSYFHGLNFHNIHTISIFVLKVQIKPKAGLERCRFSQKRNKQIWFVCPEKQKSKQNKFISSFFWRIYGAFGFIWPLVSSILKLMLIWISRAPSRISTHCAVFPEHNWKVSKKIENDATLFLSWTY